MVELGTGMMVNAMLNMSQRKTNMICAFTPHVKQNIIQIFLYSDKLKILL